MNMILKILLLIIFIPLIYVVLCLLISICTYYSPEQKIVLYENSTASPIDKKELSLTSWNIGYAGLGHNSDFFYDGGAMTRPQKEDTRHYFNGILNTVSEFNTDFVLLQEVDSSSKRSYFVNQVAELKNKVKDIYPYDFFATNYKVRFIPLPWTDPMGKVHSGLMNLSKYQPSRVERHQLPGSYSFPNKYFFLRRCLMISYYPLSSGQQLILVNVHNSAYDKDGDMKKEEMAYLKEWLANNANENNYIICGGDWNQCPPDFPYNTLAAGKEGDYFQTNVKTDFNTNGTWAYDKNTASNRKVNKPFTDKSFVTIIDFFWMSHNIEVEKVQGINQNFEYSDHHPVMINIKLK